MKQTKWVFNSKNFLLTILLLTLLQGLVYALAVKSILVLFIGGFFTGFLFPIFEVQLDESKD